MTGAPYSINAPYAWSLELWYNLGLPKLTVVGVQDLGAQMDGWQIILGDDLLRSYHITISGQTWTVTPPCAAAGG